MSVYRGRPEAAGRRPKCAIDRSRTCRGPIVRSAISGRADPLQTRARINQLGASKLLPGVPSPWSSHGTRSRTSIGMKCEQIEHPSGAYVIFTREGAKRFCVKSAHLLAEARLSTAISIGTECALRLSQPEAPSHGRGFQVAQPIDPERTSTLRDGRRGFEDSETPLASRVLG